MVNRRGRDVVPEPVDLGAEFERLVSYERRRTVLAQEMEEQLERMLAKMREREFE